jgi:hypothetical protein
MNPFQVFLCRTKKWEELSMMKSLLIGFAILAVSTSAGMAKAKPKAAAAAATTPSPMMMPPGPTAADKALYMKNQRDSGMKK